MKTYTITATCALMPVSYITSDDYDYYFTTNPTTASSFCESVVDSKISEYESYHPEYIFSKTEIPSK